jgi:hypothetical protein
LILYKKIIGLRPKLANTYYHINKMSLLPVCLHIFPLLANWTFSL